MNILIIGSGGREHALAWKIRQSPLCTRLFIAPGNAGTDLCGENVDLRPDDFEALLKFSLQEKIEMVIVGPEDPLVNGITNYFAEHTAGRILMIGPGKEGALLEGSKDFAKRFMLRNHIPTAAYFPVNHSNLEEGLSFLESHSPPFVLKADGLAAGKGVIITSSLMEAKETLTEMIGGKFGSASSTVLIEQFLQGIEISVFVLTDGKSYKILPEAKDYKPIGEGDTGPNTGGMGAVSPVPFATPLFMQKIEERIIRPTIEGLRHEKIDYRGFIFFGLINVNGEPFVIEYNARLGDPETEVIIPRIESDLVALLKAAALGKLKEETIEISDDYAVTVMLVSGGYPGTYEKGKPITGSVEKSLLFHAGTQKSGESVLTAGGRVMAITSIHAEMETACRLSYASARKIWFDGVYFRSDIGNDLKT
jgi:phosphoribosylamine---glycine ligase